MSTAAVGQSDSSSIHQQSRRDDLPSGNSTIAKNLRMWCLERNILLTAQHLSGVENVRVDRESRVMRDRSNWMLNPLVFQKIIGHFHYLKINLFATCLSSQLPRFFSWCPDPMAKATDTFL